MVPIKTQQSLHTLDAKVRKVMVQLYTITKELTLNVQVLYTKLL